MKKLLITVLAMFFVVMPAFGEEIDLEAMSLDELQALHERINIEISARMPSIEKGFNGLLIGGKSIKIGTYVFECLEQTIISQWKSEEDYVKGGKNNRYDVNEYVKGDSTIMYFDESTTVLISYGSVNIRQATEDWVPKKEE